MTDIWTFSRKEVRDLSRDPLSAVLVAVLAVAVVISVLVGAAQFRVQLDAYTAYTQQLLHAGSPVTAAPPQLFPLQLLQGGVEYIEILGALFAVILGYGTIAKEKHRGTLHLMLTRPVRRFALVGGKLLGLGLVWLIVVGVLATVSTTTIWAVGGAALSYHDLVRIGLAAIAAWIYLMFWTALSVGLTALPRQLSTGLIVSLALWLIVVLILPQIGDTMDPDNQVPGGLFASLQIKTTNELAVMSHFGSYETIRNSIEISSIEKHFERLVFGFLGIKEKFNQQPLTYIWANLYGYAITLVAASAGAIVFAAVATTRRTLQRK
ncbi:ABC transporter permease [Humibacter sp.]|uniref:ABC transporter permease n=1 Tax=Humibacter sp. TaxID=1940291 RepID=UPI003F810806